MAYASGFGRRAPDVTFTATVVDNGVTFITSSGVGTVSVPAPPPGVTSVGYILTGASGWGGPLHGGGSAAVVSSPSLVFPVSGLTVTLPGPSQTAQAPDSILEVTGSGGVLAFATSGFNGAPGLGPFAGFFGNSGSGNVAGVADGASVLGAGGGGASPGGDAADASDSGAGGPGVTFTLSPSTESLTLGAGGAGGNTTDPAVSTTTFQATLGDGGAGGDGEPGSGQKGSNAVFIMWWVGDAPASLAPLLGKGRYGQAEVGQTLSLNGSYQQGDVFVHATVNSINTVGFSHQLTRAGFAVLYYLKFYASTPGAVTGLDVREARRLRVSEQLISRALARMAPDDVNALAVDGIRLQAISKALLFGG